MPSAMPRFTFRADRKTLSKLRVIADSNYRTVNSEILLLVDKLIAEYEDEHGEIQIPDDDC